MRGMERDPATAIEQAGREEARRRESEKTIAAAYRRAVRLDLIPLAVALLDTDVAEWSSIRDGGVILTLETSPETFDALNSVSGIELSNIFGPLMPPGSWLQEIDVRVRVEDVDPDWRSRASAALGENKPVNQGTLGSIAGERYNGLRFRSYSEIVIAKELDSRGILYFPLPAASRSGVHKEPDFLIVSKGKVAILEVHGEPYHPATRAAEDHKRSLYFEESGIFVKVFDAKECRQNPKLVVDTFLGLLEGPRR